VLTELEAGIPDVVGDEDAALDAETKHPVALGVAARIPCEHCTYGHTIGAEKGDASEQEIKESVAVPAQARKLSTMLNRLQYDTEKKADLAAPQASN
jgi:AhpD family alkylhydroperoxidase